MRSQSVAWASHWRSTAHCTRWRSLLREVFAASHGLASRTCAVRRRVHGEHAPCSSSSACGWKSRALILSTRFYQGVFRLPRSYPSAYRKLTLRLNTDAIHISEKRRNFRLAGGSPASYYFVGSQAHSLFCLDPHHARLAIPLHPPPPPHIQARYTEQGWCEEENAREGRRRALTGATALDR